MGSDSEYTDAHDDMESSEDLSPSGGDGELEINGTDHDGMHHAAKRQKVGDGDHHVARDALHGAADGIDHLQEADASLLQLEVKELLQEAAVDAAHDGAVKDTLQRVGQLLLALPEATVDQKPLKGFLKDLHVELMKPFVFQPPATVTVVGSYAVGAATRSTPVADLAVEIPRTCLDDKDQLNHRYHAKRALYLAHIAAALRREAAQLGIQKVEWAVANGDPRRPSLLLHLAKGSSPAGTAIQILPTIAPGTFPLPRLAPTRNNLRSVCAPNPAADGTPQLLPTPHYNHSIVVDMLLLEHAHAFATAKAQLPHFAEAAVLLRVWARQQQLSTGGDGFTGFLLTMLLVHLVRQGHATPGMSGMHLFRTVVVALSNRKTFTGSGLVMQRNPESEALPVTGTPSSKQWRAAGGEVVFVDASGWANLAAGVSAAALKQVQDCAARTVTVLAASSGPEAFDAVFFTRHSLAALYDSWYCVAVPVAPGQASLAADRPYWVQADRQVCALVTKALGSRAALVRVVGRQASSRSSAALAKAAAGPDRDHVLVGVRLDAVAALRSVDMGPAADSGPPAQEFRAFWGEKSELRRFRDGAIAEAVVWQDGPAERHLIVDQVVRHILLRHLPPGSGVTSTGSAMDAALLRRHSTPEQDVAAARACEGAAERLGKQLRGLEGLTLRIVATQPLAAVLRHADTFPPLPHPLAGASQNALSPDHVPRCLPAVEILCQLEGSGRWPDNVDAFAKMKAALGVEVARTLHSSYGIDASAAEEFVDVLSDGFAFRLILATERDAGVQAKALAAAGRGAPLPEDDIPLRVWHQGAISAAAASNPAFEPAVRLAKRWVGAHLLSPHLPEEAVELLVAAAFAPGAGVAAPPPASRVAGLLRFFALLAEHTWSVQPLVVDPAGSATIASRQEAAARAYAAQRAAGTAPAMFIAGPNDGECVGWTRANPSRPMLHRASILAARSMQRLAALVCASADVEQEGEEAVLSEILSRDEEEYDAVIRLRRDALPNSGNDLRLAGRGRQGRRRFTALEALLCEPALAGDKHSRAVLKGIPQSILQARGPAAVRKELLIGFDPVPLYVELLRQRLGGVAVFCADYVGGAVIGVKWRAAAFEPAPLHPELAHVMAVVDESAQGLLVAPDVTAILADAAALGAGLVEGVEVASDVRK